MNSSQPTEVDLIDILAVPYRYSKLVALVSITCFVLMAAMVYRQPKRLEITTLIQIGTVAKNRISKTVTEPRVPIPLESAFNLSEKIQHGFLPAIPDASGVEVLIPDRSEGLVRLRSFVQASEEKPAIDLQAEVLKC